MAVDNQIALKIDRALSNHENRKKLSKWQLGFLENLQKTLKAKRLLSVKQLDAAAPILNKLAVSDVPSPHAVKLTNP